MIEPPSVIEIEFGSSGGKLSFPSFEAVEAFVQTEISSWDWLSQPPTNSMPNNPHGTIRQCWSQFNSNFPGLREQPLSNISANLISIATSYIVNSKIPISKSSLGVFIQKIQKEDPFRAGLILSAWMNMLPQNGNFEHFSSAAQLAAFELGIDSKGARAAKKSLDIAIAENSSKLAELAIDIKNQKNTFNETIAYNSRLEKVKAKYFAHKLKQHKKLKDLEISEAIKNFQSMEALYREQMHLKGPVEYWQSKHAQHLNRAKIYRNFLVGFAGVGGGTLVLGLYWLSGHAISVASDKTPSAVYLILATLGAVSSTIIFWIGRVLTRLYLSEHHLSIDSEERSTMALTYLALTADGKVSDNERVLVLSALFRPTSDGIVKDDAVPDMSSGAVLSQLMTK